MSRFTALSLQDFASAFALALAMFTITYTTSLCITPPNSNPRTDARTARAGFVAKVTFFYYLNAVVQLIGIYHALLCFTYPTPPSILCPRPSNLSPLLFTWNYHTVLCVVLILYAGWILLQCFIHLGPNVTFQLMTPK